MVEDSVYGANVTAVTVVNRPSECAPEYGKGVIAVHVSLKAVPEVLVSVAVPKVRRCRLTSG